jgi:hypothetical protein
MRKHRKELETTFESVNMETAPTIIPPTHESLLILTKNQAVY